MAKKRVKPVTTGRYVFEVVTVDDPSPDQVQRWDHMWDMIIATIRAEITAQLNVTQQSA